MSPTPGNKTLAQVVRTAAKSKTFARKLMKDPQAALKEKGWKLPAVDLQMLIALRAQTIRMVAEAQSLRDLMVQAGFVGPDGAGPGLTPPPPWPWPIEWNEETGAIGDRIRSLADKIMVSRIILSDPIIDARVKNPMAPSRPRASSRGKIR